MLSCTQGMKFNELHSKTKILEKHLGFDAEAYPEWSYDGSSTGQAEGNNSDLIIRPVRICPDPIRGGDHVLVMTEVFGRDGKPHASNTRAGLRAVFDDKVKEQKCW